MSHAESPLTDALFLQSPLAVALYDTDGRVALGNAAYERHFGIRLADVPPEYSLFTDPQLEAAGLLPPIRRAYDGETCILPPVQYDAAQAAGGVGRSVWTQAHCFPVRDGEGTVTHVAMVHVDVTALASATISLGATEARLRFALDVASMGAWDLDLVSGQSWRSLRHDQLFGYPEGRQAWTYDDFLAHVHPDDRDVVHERFGGALEDQGAWDFTCRIRRANDAAVRWIAARGEPVADESGRIVRMAGVVRDVTEQVEARHQIEQLLSESEAARAEAETARAEAESASRAKGEFLAVMSHELRTPLNAIGGYAELIEMGIRGPVTPQQLEDLRRIQASQRHLLGLVNEVLNYAKLETGNVRYDLTDVRVLPALTAAEVLVAPQARNKGLELSVSDCPPDLVVRADREKLQQILLNLLSNAIKFTQPRDGRLGCIRIKCTVPDDRTDDRASIHVGDTGPGIAADQLTRVFEPFVQVDQRLTRLQEGVGLGLAISRDLARGMGGDLTVESTLGAGSTFTLVLPRGAG